MTFSSDEIHLATVEIKAEAMVVAAEHCSYLRRNGVTVEAAMHMIGAANRSRGWSYAISAYCSCWTAMELRRIQKERLT